MKYTEETIQEIERYLSSGNSIVDTCLLAGISKETFYEWSRTKPDFSDRVKKAEAICKARNIALIQSIASGRRLKRKRTLQDGTVIEEEYEAEKPNWFAAAWWLERKYRDEFATKTFTQGDLTIRPDKSKFEELLENVDADRRKQIIAEVRGKLEGLPSDSEV